MESLLDRLPEELLFTIILHLDLKEDLNNLIYSSEELIYRFVPEKTWRKMFHQNIDQPIINEKYLWRDNYYNNMDLDRKYDINVIVGSHRYSYIIISTYEGTEQLLTRIPDVKRAIKSIQGEVVDGSEQLDENTDLIFITYPGIFWKLMGDAAIYTRGTGDDKFVYKNKLYEEFISDLFSRDIIDYSSSICIKPLYNLIDEDVTMLIDDLNYFIHGGIYKRVTFEFKGASFIQLNYLQEQ